MLKLCERNISIITEINRSGTTILLVEQNANMALSIARRAYVLETGKIVLSGPSAEMASNPEVRKAYLGNGFNQNKGVIRTCQKSYPSWQVLSFCLSCPFLYTGQ